MNIKITDHPIIKSAGPISLHLIPDRIEDKWRWSVKLNNGVRYQGMCKRKESAFLSAKQAARKFLSEIEVKINEMTI